MSRDPQFLLMIQIALIGIVVVIGFFYIWKTLSRLEARIDELSSRACYDINQSCSMVSNALTQTQTQNKQTIFGGKNIKYNETEEELSDEGDADDAGDISDDAEHLDDFEDADDHDISLMKACFGGIPLHQLMEEAISPFTVFKTINISENDRNSESESDTDNKNNFTKKRNIFLVDAEDIENGDDANSKDNLDTEKHVNDDNVSLVDTDTNEYSKTKLKKMNLDTLREICSTRGLQTEGNKANLIDRILSSFPTSA